MIRIAAIMLTLGLAAGACSGPSAKLAEPGGGPDGPWMLRSLVAFDDCDDLLDHIKSEALDRVGPYGLDTGTPRIWFGGDGIALFDEMRAGDVALDASSGTLAPAPRGVTTSAPADGDASSTDGLVGTNVQERGVDEPDVIKTDGTLILVVSDGTLTVVDVASTTARGSIGLPESWDHELFFEGDRALLFSNVGAWGDLMPLAGGAAPEAAVDAIPPTGPSSRTLPATWPSEPWAEPAAIITEIDLSDPDDPRIAGTLRVEGQYLSARLVAGEVRLALSSSPSRLPWVHPGGPGSENRAESFNRQLVKESTIDDWLPVGELTVGNVSKKAPLLDCERLHRPSGFAGFEVISVLSFDMARGLGLGKGAGVLASGRTVYSSTDAFYVATTRWEGPGGIDSVDEATGEDGVATDIHAFAIEPGAPARYQASGSLTGSLLDRFSMDEHDGYLRVITTSGSSWGTTEDSESSLSVLAVEGDELVTVGRVDGLGRGEALYSARILDDVAFAVTFRQIDPFFVIDLSDPETPEIEGELKLPGFSTYLHPLPGDRVLGIGQDATDQGRTTGFKITLFDVADPRSPAEVAGWTAEGATSVAEHDPRAFQLVGDIAVIPLQDWSRGFNGAVLLEIGRDSITEVGRITHEVAKEREGCSPIEPDSLGDGSNELAWIVEEGALVLLCSDDDPGPNQKAGHPCERIVLDDLHHWGVSSSPAELRSDLDVTDGHHIELCWPHDDWRSRIVRSLGTEELLWTMSGALLQANDITTLETRAAIPIPPVR